MQPHGDSVLFQYFYWAYSHPVIHVVLLISILMVGAFWFRKRRSLSL